MRTVKRLVIAAALTGALGACTNPYDPGQRALGGAAIGAGSGALLGGVIGGGRGALTGALIGGAVGAVGGAVTTPQRPDYRNYDNGPGPGYYQRNYDNGPGPGYYQRNYDNGPGYYQRPGDPYQY